MAIAVRRVLSIGVVLAVAIIVVALVVRLTLTHWISSQPFEWGSTAIPPVPRLQSHPDADLAALRAQKDALLSTWAWTSPKHEFARISIERAMALYARPTTAAEMTSERPQPGEPAR